MRLREWRSRAPAREAMTTKVLAIVEPVLSALGAGHDPECWVAWGDEPATRYTILAPTPAGLITCHVRVNLPQEGPRCSAKLARWNRVQLGELGIETQGTHRLLSFQVESQVLRGVDAEADAVAAFAVGLIAAVDGRAPAGAPSVARTGKGASRTAPRGATTRSRAASASAGPPAGKPATATGATKGRAGMAAGAARPASAGRTSSRRAG
jgi:hypothetical protein